MKTDTYLMFINALGGSDDAHLHRASTYTAVEIASASTVQFKFPAGNGSAGTSDVTLTLPANLGTTNELKFKHICKILSGAFNKASGKVLVVADEVNGEYIAPFTGAVVCDDVS